MERGYTPYLQVTAISVIVALAYVIIAFSTSRINFWAADVGDGRTFVRGAQTLTSSTPYYTFDDWPDAPGRAIVYPAILAALGTTDRTRIPYVAVAWNIVMLGVAVFSAATIAQRFGFSVWSAVPVIWIGLPWTTMIMTDLTAVALLYASLALLIATRGYRSALVGGVVLGVAALTRNAMLSLAFVGLAVLFSNIGWRRAVLAFVTMIIVIIPYTVYHHSRTGDYAIETFGLRHQLAAITIPAIEHGGNLSEIAKRSVTLWNELPAPSVREHRAWLDTYIEHRLRSLPSPLMIMDYAVAVPGWALLYSGTPIVRNPWPGMIPYWVSSLLACITGVVWLVCAFIAIRHMRIGALLGIGAIVGVILAQLFITGPLNIDRVLLPASLAIGIVYTEGFRCVRSWWTAR